MGAPKNNQNNLRHGLRGASLPKGCTGILKAVNAFRRIVEEAVLHAKGEITLYDAALVHSAFRWERHACLCQRWLTEAEALTHADKVNYSREIARASSERDKCLKALGLEENRSIADALYGSPARLTAGEPNPASDETSATESTVFQ